MGQPGARSGGAQGSLSRLRERVGVRAVGAPCGTAFVQTLSAFTAALSRTRERG